MIDSADELADLLSTTGLRGKGIVALSVLNTSDTALALDIMPTEAETAWATLRDLVDQTGRWPIVSSAWSSNARSIEARLTEEDPFSRFFYREAPGADDISPRGLIEKSGKIDVDEFIAQLDAKSAQGADAGWAAEWLEEDLDTCMALFGRLPEQGELDQSIVHPAARVDRWIFEQLLASNRAPEQQVSEFSWFEPDNAYALLLPVSSGWEALAYCHFFGAYEGSEYYIAVGRRWEEQFGAELVCHYGTMLQCRVSDPPGNPESAWRLAREHHLLTSNTLGATNIRDYARGLGNMNRWFLHDRP